MKNLQLKKELLFSGIIAIISLLLILPFYPYLSIKYMLFIAVGVFLIAQYFRVVLFERKIIWMRPFYMKVLLWLINIPLVFLVITWMMNFNAQLEDYSYNISGVYTHDIFPGLTLQQFSALRSVTLFICIVLIIVIFLFQLRIIYSIFKYREVPNRLKG